MDKILLLGLSLVCVAATISTTAEQKFKTDVIKTSKLPNSHDRTLTD
jgi:hypothetical protein